MGSAAGLGNLWRFGYLVYSYGGGAFLVPYAVALVVIGLPLLTLEFALGILYQRAAPGVYRAFNRHAGIVGWWALINSMLIMSYYFVIIAWALRFVAASFTLGWEERGPEAFFNNIVLQRSAEPADLGGLSWWLVLCLGLVWAMVYFSVFKGVTSVKRVVAVTMPVPLALILVLLVRALTLPGSLDGVLLYLTPELGALFDTEVITAACGQIFFSLSLGYGIMIVYASYMTPDSGSESDMVKNAIYVAGLNTVVSLLSGFVVFGTVGFLAYKQQVDIQSVVQETIGLAFVVFPAALSEMPAPRLVSVIFFLTLVLLGIDSAFSGVEAVSGGFRDMFHGSDVRYVSLYVCFVVSVLSLPYVTGAGIYYLEVVDHFMSNYGLIAVGMLQCLIAGWSAEGERVVEFLGRSSGWMGKRAVHVWWWLIRLVIPVILAFLLVTQFALDYVTPFGGYPNWLLAIGWSVVVVPPVLAIAMNRWTTLEEKLQARTNFDSVAATKGAGMAKAKAAAAALPTLAEMSDISYSVEA